MSDESLYAAFVQAMEANRVMVSDGVRREPYPKQLRRQNWSMESYHFGDLLDPGNPESLWGSVWPRIVRDRPRSTTTYTPRVTSAYSLTIHGLPHVIIKRMRVIPRFGERPVFSCFWLAPDGVWEVARRNPVEPLRLAKLADWVLANREIVEVEPRPKVRLTRPSMNSRILPGTTIINLKRRVYPIGPTLRPGSMKRPHERRSHYRTLRGGKVVAVRSSSIRGGTGRPRSYRVRK